MFTLPSSFRLARPALSAAAAALSLAVGPLALPARAAVTLQVPHDLTLARTQLAPYNFSGRVFALDNTGAGFGTGTLLRRHTVVTAGHVVYAPTTGFIANALFDRALYESYSLSKSQIIAVSALSGYQSAVTTSGSNTTLAAFALDQGYVLLHDAPANETWGNYQTMPSLLSSTATQLLVLGYPGVTFDGLTLAYIVPTASFTPLGSSTTTGSYVNSSYIAEEGMSGGPIYYVQNPALPNPADQYVVATTVGGNGDKTGEFNASFVRAIDKVAGKAIADAEYTSGLIKRVKIVGPKTVQRGQTYTYTTNIQFAVPTASGAKATTNRYAELKLKSTGTSLSTSPAIVIKKTSNTTFDVTYTATARPNTTATLQVFYDKTATPIGNSSLTVQVQ